MDDLIYLLLDLVSDLLGWLLPLIGKFWFLILGYLGYKIFGQAAKKAAQDQKRRTLTPVESGGYPTPPQKVERKTIRASSRYEPVQVQQHDDEGWDHPPEREAEFDRGSLEGMDRERTRVKVLPDVPKAEPKPAIDLDPREGMKWALIFGEPRSKRPYTSPTTRGRSE